MKKRNLTEFNDLFTAVTELARGCSKRIGNSDLQHDLCSEGFLGSVSYLNNIDSSEAGQEMKSSNKIFALLEARKIMISYLEKECREATLKLSKSEITLSNRDIGSRIGEDMRKLYSLAFSPATGEHEATQAKAKLIKYAFSFILAGKPNSADVKTRILLYSLSLGESPSAITPALFQSIGKVADLLNDADALYTKLDLEEEYLTSLAKGEMTVWNFVNKSKNSISLSYLNESIMERFEILLNYGKRQTEIISKSSSQGFLSKELSFADVIDYVEISKDRMAQTYFKQNILLRAQIFYAYNLKGIYKAYTGILSKDDVRELLEDRRLSAKLAIKMRKHRMNKY